MHNNNQRNPMGMPMYRQPVPSSVGQQGQANPSPQFPQQGMQQQTPQPNWPANSHLLLQQVQQQGGLQQHQIALMQAQLQNQQHQQAAQLNNQQQVAYAQQHKPQSSKRHLPGSAEYSAESAEPTADQSAAAAGGASEIAAAYATEFKLESGSESDPG
jgi:hypothetical protein